MNTRDPRPSSGYGSMLPVQGAASVPVSLPRDGTVQKKEHRRVETGREKNGKVGMGVGG